MSNERARRNAGVRVWEMLLRTQAALVRTLEDEVERSTGLPLSWYDVLLELSRAPEGRLRMSELGERVVLSRSRVSRVVDAMADAGLVVKQPDPSDGRATLATLTPEGRGAQRRTAPPYLRGIDRHFTTHLTKSELGILDDALSRVLAADSEHPRATGDR